MASLPYPRSHQTIFPQKPQNLTQSKHLWASVKSVGEYSSPVVSVNSVKSVGGLQRAAWVWQDAIPSYENSHRLHRCAQIRRQKRNLKICEHLWNLWENIPHQSFLWIRWNPWEDFRGCVGMAGCHTLLRKLPQIARMCTLSLQKKAIRLNNQGKTMIAKDSFVPLL